MARTRRIRAGGDDGFTLIEVMVAMLVLIVAVFSLTYILVNSLADTAYARQRAYATNLANQTIEEVRSIPWSSLTAPHLSTGMVATDVTGSTQPTCGVYPGGCDANVSTSGCFEGKALWVGGTSLSCAVGGPTLWQDPGCLSQNVSQSPPLASSLSSPQPVSPHQSCYLVGGLKYAVDVYITGSGNLLTATVYVTWGHPFRSGLSDHVVSTTELSPCLKGTASC